MGLKKIAKDTFWPFGKKSLIVYGCAIVLGACVADRVITRDVEAEICRAGEPSVLRKYDRNGDGRLDYAEKMDLHWDRCNERGILKDFAYKLSIWR